MAINNLKIFIIIFCAICGKVTAGDNTTNSISSNTEDTRGFIDTTQIVDQDFRNYSKVLSRTSHLKDVYTRLLLVQDIYIIPLACPIGIVGNSLVAHNLFINRNSNSSFIYIFFILMADILSLISDIFLPISRLLQSYESAGMASLAAYLYFWNADIISFLFRRFSLNIFCVLSYERLTAIKKPLHLCRSITVSHSHWFLVLSFFVGFLATIVTPLFTKMSPKYDAMSNTTKYERGLTDLYKNNEDYFAVVMIVCRFLDGPLQVSFFTIINIKIIRCLYENKKSMALSSNKDRTKSISKVQARLCKIFLMLCFTNMLAFFPNAVIIIIGKFFPQTGLTIKSYTMQLIMFGGNFLRVLNSLTDFVVFLVMSKDIRDDIKQKIMCQQNKEKDFKGASCKTVSNCYM